MAMALQAISHASERDDQKSSDRSRSVSDFWRDIFAKKPSINWLSTAVNEKMQFESSETCTGRKGLCELQEHIQNTHMLDGIAILVLRCESKPESKSSAKFVFGRCVGSHVSRLPVARRERLQRNAREIAKIFCIKHLIVDTDQTMKGWTPQELSRAFALCDVGGQLQSIDFGSGDYQLPKPPARRKRSTKWQGFVCQDEAEAFGRKYYGEILTAMTSPRRMCEHRKLTNKFFEPSVCFVGNGLVCHGIESWARVCDDFVRDFSPTSASLSDFNITAFSSLSFVATFRIKIEFDAERTSATIINEGTVSVMMSRENKKISHIVEASTPPSLQRIRERRRHRNSPESITAQTKDT